LKGNSENNRFLGTDGVIVAFIYSFLLCDLSILSIDRIYCGAQISGIARVKAWLLHRKSAARA
jgi:hypothetical protein